MSRMSYQLEADEEAGIWRRVAVWDAEDPLGPIRGEIFELSEPVHVDNSFPRLDSAEQRVFWIARFAEHKTRGGEVWLTHTRYGGHGDTSVSPARLRKLPAMLRLACEATE